MPRRAKVRYVSLKSCLVNLPLSVYGPLVEHQVRPQSLAIHLAKQEHRSSRSGDTPTAAYVGWTGMAAASSLAAWNSSSQGSETHLETIEMDPQYAQTFGFAENDVVEIGLLHKLPLAKAVHTEPLTADDWEILELHAEYVESHLLSQVRVAAVGQEVDVWVLGRTRIRFRVVSYEPSGPAVLLSTDTEVVIAPKTRSSATTKVRESKSKNDVSGPSVATPSEPDGMPKSNHSRKRVTLRILPSSILPHQPPSSGQDEAPTTILVSQTTFQELTNTQHNDRPSGSQRYVRVKRLRPPSTHLGDTGDVQSSSTVPSAKVLQGTKSSNTDASKTSKASPLCLLMHQSQMPTGNCALVPGASGFLDSAEDWDLVILTLVDSIDQPSRSTRPTTMVSTSPTSVKEQKHGLAGVDAIMLQAQSFIVNAFAVQAVELSTANSLNHHRMPGILLCGATGSGRTSVAKEIARLLERDQRTYTYILYVDLAKHSEDPVAVLKNRFQSWLNIAAWHQPSLMILDNLDRTVGPEVEHADSFRSKHIAEVFLSVFNPSRPPAGVAMIATCQGQTALHPLLSTAHIFSTRLTLKPPNKEARKDILARIVAERCSMSDVSQDPVHPLNFTTLATLTDGYSANDLRDLVGKAMHEAILRSSKVSLLKPYLMAEDFTAAQIGFTPLSLRDVQLQHSEVRWSDIGGLHETRRVLRETLEWPTKYGAIFAKCPLRLRSGLLLYGYPGCGKTLLASAVAKECGLNFISVKGPELLNKYIGASEKSVRDIFDRASAAKPCVLFFDEFDSIAPKRGHDSTGVTDRVVNQMLTQMDGAEGLDGVYVLAATSRPDLIDPALLRPGRLDKSLLCGMPDEQERLEILRAFSQKVAVSDSVDLGLIARDTEGYSGADLQAIIYNAHLEVVHQTISAQEEQLSSNAGKGGEDEGVDFTTFGGAAGRAVASKAEEAVLKRRLEVMMVGQRKSVVVSSAPATATKHVVQEVHLRKSLESTRPSVSEEERRRLEKTYRAFVSERSGQLPVPSEDMTIGSRQSLG
ncbi:Peroxisome biosynthesis protein pex1 [Tulasnella sp. JGI-2019a]|nr:Peroxisome biosynthesis protein pex1 [Tulasnella sp. JGI-2019a]